MNYLASSGKSYFGYNITELDITEVYYGNADGDTISITEEYYVDKGILSNNIWVQGAYLPANEGEEYIFFLKKYEDESERYSNMYFPIDLEYGKYVVSAVNDDEIKADILEVNADEVQADYYDYYKAVRDYYLNSDSPGAIIPWHTETADEKIEEKIAIADEFRNRIHELTGNDECPDYYSGTYVNHEGNLVIMIDNDYYSDEFESCDWYHEIEPLIPEDTKVYYRAAQNSYSELQKAVSLLTGKDFSKEAIELETYFSACGIDDYQNRAVIFVSAENYDAIKELALKYVDGRYLKFEIE